MHGPTPTLLPLDTWPALFPQGNLILLPAPLQMDANLHITSLSSLDGVNQGASHLLQPHPSPLTKACCMSQPLILPALYRIL